MSKPNLQEVVDKISALGSADQIAHFLEQQGIKAVRSCSLQCALAEYIKRELGTAVQVNKAGISIRGTFEGAVLFHDRETTAVVPEYSELRNFIHNFDRGKYPHLQVKEA